MKLTLLDYISEPVEFEIGELDTIASIDIEVWTGDEIAIVRYKNGSKMRFDSDLNERITGYLDYDYILYDEEAGINRLNDPAFLERKNSYAYTTVVAEDLKKFFSDISNILKE